MLALSTSRISTHYRMNRYVATSLQPMIAIPTQACSTACNGGAAFIQLLPALFADSDKRLHQRRCLPLLSQQASPICIATGIPSLLASKSEGDAYQTESSHGDMRDISRKLQWWVPFVVSLVTCVFIVIQNNTCGAGRTRHSNAKYP